jgi:23S rRNA (adenine2503-C2)-methyltransferase
MMRCIKDITEAELAQWLKAHNQPAFRAKQLHAWLYSFTDCANDFAQMANLPKALREALSAEFAPCALTPCERLVDNEDGTVKWLSELLDGNTIETVLIRVPERSTVCISTQVGCPVRCVFCASGRHGLIRNLTSTEIVEQVLLASRELKQRVDNIVVMGMGEPLLNLDNLLPALNFLYSDDAIMFGQRHVTISTSGIVPGILRLAETKSSWNLALSLHAVNDEERAKIIPTEYRYPLEEIFAACEEHRRQTNRMLTLEYALIAGRNDDSERMSKLSQIAHRLRAKVNLIPCNPAGSNCSAPALQRCRQCVNELTAQGVQATLRLSHGRNIIAACGQLRQRSQR